MNLYRDATVKDAFKVVNNLRDEDRAEMEGIGHSCLTLPFGVLVSEHAVYFFSKEGKPAGLAGIFREENNVGQIWMLCTPVIHDAPITFVREAKKWLEHIQGEYTLLWNIADARNQVHHKLLKHLGFKALRKVAVGPNHLPYYEIIKLCAQ